MTSSNGNIFRVTGPSAWNSPVTGEFPSQRLVMFSLMNKRLSKESRRRWFETPSCLLWHHCNVITIKQTLLEKGRPSSAFFVLDWLVFCQQWRSVVTFMKQIRMTCGLFLFHIFSLLWRHNEFGGVSDHQPHDCLLNRLFSDRSKKTSKFRVTDLCAGNSPGTGEIHAQRASNAENVSIWWRHHVVGKCRFYTTGFE